MPTNPAETTVLYEERGAVAIATLNRPQALNSFTRQMHRDLGAALERVEANPAIRALVITGAGRGFCAGADLAEFDFEPGPDLVAARRPRPGDRPGVQPHRAAAPGPARAHHRGRQRRRRRRRGFAGHDLRHRHCRAHGQLHPGLQQDRPDSRRGRHLVAAPARGHGARHGAGHDRRQVAGRAGQGVGNDLGRGRRLRWPPPWPWPKSWPPCPPRRWWPPATSCATAHPAR